MEALLEFPLPLSPHGPPDGYAWVESDTPVSSITTGIGPQDAFLKSLCAICGWDCSALQQSLIIKDSETQAWSDLKHRSWIPHHAGPGPKHEPRNGLLMCPNHRSAFDSYYFFIRYVPNTRRFIFVNFTNSTIVQQFHGKAIALDPRHGDPPFPSLFIIHEMRVRGYHPFEPTKPDVPIGSPWQDWISSKGAFEDDSGSFRIDMPASVANDGFPVQRQSPRPSHPTTMTTCGTSSGYRPLPRLNVEHGYCRCYPCCHSCVAIMESLRGGRYEAGRYT